MSLYEPTAERDPNEGFRLLADQLNRDAVILLPMVTFAGEIPVTPGTPLTVDRFVLSDVPCPEFQLEEVSVTFHETFTADPRRYWTIEPYYLNADRDIRFLATAKTTATSRFTANAPVSWTVSQKLVTGGAIMFRFTPSNAPDDIGAVTLQGVLRRGVR